MHGHLLCGNEIRQKELLKQSNTISDYHPIFIESRVEFNKTIKCFLIHNSLLCLRKLLKPLHRQIMCQALLPYHFTPSHSSLNKIDQPPRAIPSSHDSPVVISLSLLLFIDSDHLKKVFIQIDGFQIVIRFLLLWLLLIQISEPSLNSI